MAPVVATKPEAAIVRSRAFLLAVSIGFSVLFMALCLSCYAFPGLQQDEALFARCLFQDHSALFTIRLFHHDVAAMLMTYLGTLKTWVYAPILYTLGPSIATIRMPGILLGAVTIAMATRLAYRFAGLVAAFCCGALLATDAMFILTTDFDWGPVVFQHFLFMAALTQLTKHLQDGRNAALFFAALCAGLALWDKALFVWLFSAGTLAAALIFTRAFARWISLARASVIVAGVLIGALPLVVYNSRKSFVTFRSNAQLAKGEVMGKAIVMRNTLDGSGLFGYLVSDAAPGPERSPQSLFERISVKLTHFTGERRRNGLQLISFVALLAAPFILRGLSARLFVWMLITMLGAWAEMLWTHGAGGSVHHTILLWPLPQLAIAIVAGEAVRRAPRFEWPVIALVIAGAVLNTLNFNQYVSQMIRYGSPGPWTDAVTAFAERARSFGPHGIAVFEWGLASPACVLNRNQPPVIDGDQFIDAAGSHAEKMGRLHHLTDDPGLIWGAWANHWLTQAGAEQFLREMDGFGYKKRPVAMIKDRNGRDEIELFRFARLK